MVRLGIKLSIKKNKIGILGGSFDLAHKGHLAISKEALKRFNLKSVTWAITNQSPFKKKSKNNLEKRIKFCKKIIGKNKFIEVKFFEDIIKSNKTADLINHLSKDEKYDLYFLMGADNLINFHKWYKWKLISKKCNIIVFDRHGYKKKSLNSQTFKSLNEKTITFVEFNKVNISSSQLRKI
ncbi:nicotinate (nicotinamide) nucleotide adenylyltransferase [Candidatus Pelagibacter sp.]|jgi:nicotinate-nucleotide adenylyltransferase|nr:nicotinate (nicotinamide) nucleotide adenylyltransferase [Candidatus Pelagibacter sp.]